MKIVIRAGGSGSRLWPLSRKGNPKQFQALLGDQSMIRSTYERVVPIVRDPSDIYVTTSAMHRGRVQAAIPEISADNIIGEAVMKNTGPAMCLEVCYLERFCDADDVVASIPSDDYVSDQDAFRDLLHMSADFLREHRDMVLTPAVKPGYPDTGYTYFKAGKSLQSAGEEAVYEIADVVEKPNAEFLGDLLKSGVYYAHTGMYIWRLGHAIALFKKLQPQMYSACADIAAMMKHDPDDPSIAERYRDLEAMSIETAITEKADKLAMSVSDRIGWSDVGKWHAVQRIFQRTLDENVTRGRVVTRDAENNLIISTSNKKIVVVNNIKDVVVVDTDDALFVSSLQKSDEVKQILEQLKEEGYGEYL